MIRSFFSHLSWLMILNLLVKPAYLLVIDARIQDILGPEVFGTFFPLLSLGIMLNTLLDWGMTTYMTRTVAASPGLLTTDYRKARRIKIALIPSYWLVLIGIGWMLGYAAEPLGWLAWIALNQTLWSFVLYTRAGLQGLGKHREDAWVSVLDRTLLFIGLGSVLLLADGFDIRWLLCGTTAAFAVTLGFSGFLLQRAARVDDNQPPKTPTADFRSIIGKSLPHAWLFLLMMAYYRVDAIMLERIHPDGAREAGYYAMGYRLFEALNMMGWLVATVLLPYFSRMTSVGQNVQPLLRTASIMLFVFSAIPAIVATLFPEILLGFFYQNSIEPAAVILPGLIIAFAFVAQSFVFSTLLTAQGQLRILIRLALAGTVVNIGLNTYWIPEYGGLGCAWSSALTQGAVLIAQVAIVLRQQRHASWWRWVRALLTYTFLSAIIIGVWVRWGEESTGQLLLVTAALAFASLTPGVVAWRQVRATFSASDRPQ